MTTLSVVNTTDNQAEAKGYGINWDTAEKRAKELKDYLMAAPQIMDPERLKFLLEVYEKHQGEPVVYIRAKLLERVLTGKKIFLDGNPLVGTLTGVRAGVYAYPEWNVSWIKEEMQMAKMASLGEMKIPAETQDLLEKTYKLWRGRTCIDQNNQMYKEKYGVNPKQYAKAGMYYENVSVASGSGIADYGLVLNKGLRYLIDDVKKRLEECPTTLADRDRIDLYRSMLITFDAVIAHSHRYADLAEQTAAEEADPKTKAELLEIAEICRRVPEHPARNFREAIQSFWFLHLCVATEQMACAVSPGRYGQYMYPFFKKDIDEGNLTREQVLTLLKFQWIRHLELGEYQGNSYALTLSGHTGQSITIGGVDANGEDACTELEELLLETQIQMRSIQPTLTLLYHPKIKDSYMQKVVECIRGGSGQPQILNNNVVVQRTLARFAQYPDGITLEDARNCGNYGCVSTGVCGKGSFITQEDQPCLAKVVELVLNNGKCPVTKKKVGVETGDPTTFETFEDLYDAAKKQLDNLFHISRAHSDLSQMARLQVVPSVFRSAMYDGCIEKGMCEEAGGTRYPQVNPIMTAGIDAANSLLAIKHLVFDTKTITMEQLLEAIKANFEGFEDIRKMCFDAPKHGNDYPEVEKFVQRFYRDVDTIHSSQGPDCFGQRTPLDAYSLSYHNYFGSMMGALPNGRKAGVALTDGSVSAMPGTDHEGITALIKSGAEAIDTVRYGANHFNVKVNPQVIEGPAGARTLISLIKTYCDFGGSHIQFNCVSSETLKDAKAHPQEYPDLVVRVAGFSAYFTRLDCGVQNEIIKRTEYQN
ncbi:glycyl radical protein [Pseudodesulfovibrio thermohalotolerans]|uniref:glycyl radical protein n=1 Tax=Pseudodesulfovibrio thermohalotolerans TaxID=2880651 RepID=UPI002441D4D5|nr:glycyl radical protein [Pseudodesulfovibrio thermohalotolerans]WFS62226.1 glycyl radical protein [Pseudodesulfovibrio thermohalotolerans]